jgi:fructose-bisphosphate aldolase class 1
MNLAALNEIAERVVTPGKGLLAPGESSNAIKRRFDVVGVDSTETLGGASPKEQSSATLGCRSSISVPMKSPPSFVA